MIASGQAAASCSPKRRREVLLRQAALVLTHVVRQLELSEKLGDGQREAGTSPGRRSPRRDVYDGRAALLPVAQS